MALRPVVLVRTLMLIVEVHVSLPYQTKRTSCADRTQRPEKVVLVLWMVRMTLDPLQQPAGSAGVTCSRHGADQATSVAARFFTRVRRRRDEHRFTPVALDTPH
jgi:hypothetical protein